MHVYIVHAFISGRSNQQGVKVMTAHLEQTHLCRNPELNPQHPPRKVMTAHFKQTDPARKQADNMRMIGHLWQRLGDRVRDIYIYLSIYLSIYLYIYIFTYIR